MRWGADVERLTSTPRDGWETIVEQQGLIYHHTADGVYWDESACYRFTAREVDELEAATNELQARCLDAAQHVIDNNRFAEFGIPAAAIPAIKWAWDNEPPAIYGRFDLIYDGKAPAKLLEYNADTPTALLEAAVVQWRWLEQAIRPRVADADQFNSLHEKLIASWRALTVTWSANTLVHFTCSGDSEEECGNLDYLRDVATQGGAAARFIAIEDIGWDEANRVFVDDRDDEIHVLCKLYPWEWLARESFGPDLLTSSLRVVEPAWKMLLSNKALLPILWELFPDHPNLLPAYFEPGRITGDFVAKPLLSREGENVRLHVGGTTVEAGGSYGAEGCIYQAYTPVPRFGDDYVTIGAWIIGDAPAGIGLREDTGPITRNTSRFVPHYFV
jgi:glutathionylspermidine synthase